MFGPGLGWQELVLILLIVAMIFGTSKLSGIGSDLGKGIKEFKKEAGEALDDGDENTEKLTDGKKVDSVASVPTSVERKELRADEI